MYSFFRQPVVVFHKTGSLTEGVYAVLEVWPTDVMGPETLVLLAGAVEAHADNAVGRAIVAKARAMRLRLPEATNVVFVPGQGVSGTVTGAHIRVIGRRYIDEHSIEIPRAIRGWTERVERRGNSVVYILRDNACAGAVVLSNTIRSESKGVIDELVRRRIRVVMITGDTHLVAQAVADQLGIVDYRANLSVEEKSAITSDLEKEGTRVIVGERDPKEVLAAIDSSTIRGLFVRSIKKLRGCFSA